MVLGITRAKPRSAGAAPFGPRWAGDRSSVTRDWLAGRGAILFEATCDLIGGFPGFAERGGRLAGAHLRVTDGYLLVEEGAPHGFGLPIRWLDGLSMLPHPNREEYALRVFYRDGVCSRHFTVRFRANRLALRGSRRSERARAALLACGLVDCFATHPPAEPDFVIPWDQTEDVESENVIWTGRLTAPVRVGLDIVPSDAWLTTRSLIWGSGAGDGINRLPLALLLDVVSTQLGDRQGTPAVYLALGDDATGRYDLPFVFDQQTPSERNQRERGAFLVGLRSRGIPLGSPAPLFQPWRLDVYPVAAAGAAGPPPPDEDDASSWEPGGRVVDIATRRESGVPAAQPGATFPYRGWPVPSVDDSDPMDDPSNALRNGRGIAAAMARQPTGDSPADRFHFAWEIASTVAAGPPCAVGSRQPAPAVAADRVLAEWSAPVVETGDEATPPRQAEDVQVAATWIGAPDDVMENVAPVASPAPPRLDSDAAVAAPNPAAETMAHPTADGRAEPLIEVKAYEALCLGALAEVLQAIDDRAAGRPSASLVERPPAAAQQAKALAEMIERTGSGRLSLEEARARTVRLVALGEAEVRLRTLLELRDAGHLGDDDLALKRRAITTQLAAVIDIGGR